MRLLQEDFTQKKDKKDSIFYAHKKHLRGRKSPV